MTYFGINVANSEPRRIKARDTLQKKVGSGELDMNMVKRVQKYLDNLEIDYDEIANEKIAEIEVILGRISDFDHDRAGFLEDIIKPFVDLKATAGTFNEDVISNLSGIILALLERSGDLDDDLVDVIRVHNNALHTVLRLGLRNINDRRAVPIIMEIKQACMRYEKKHG